jgi:hypothetical protein
MIQQKKKRCKDCGRMTYIWSGNRCKFCDAKYRAKTQNKHPQKPVKRLSNKSGYKIPVRRRKPPSGLTNKITSFGFKSQVEWMEYQDTKHRDSKGRLFCYLTGKEIPYKKGDDMWFSVWAHILRKSSFPLFKLHEENCKPLLPEVHNLVDNYISEYRDAYPEIDFDKWFGLQEHMKKKYDEFKKLYML